MKILYGYDGKMHRVELNAYSAKILRWLAAPPLWVLIQKCWWQCHGARQEVGGRILAELREAGLVDHIAGKSLQVTERGLAAVAAITKEQP